MNKKIVAVITLVGFIGLGAVAQSAIAFGETPTATIVASPLGRSAAAGTVDDPLDLATALSATSPVTAGGTLLLRGGTYTGAFTSELKATADRPIVARSYPGEWAVLDGSTAHAPALTVRGTDTWFRDFEVTRSDPQRRSAQAGSLPTDISRGLGEGVSVFGPRTKLINLSVHDQGTGVGLWQPAVDAEVYGCMIFNNGWTGPDGAHGHGIYVQNREGTKRITDSVIFDNFGFGIHGYGKNAHVSGIVVSGTTSFRNGAPANRRLPNLHIGAEHNPSDRIEIAMNAFYHDTASNENVRLGYRAAPNGSASVRHNVISGGSAALRLYEWQKLEVLTNRIYGPASKWVKPTLVSLRRPSVTTSQSVDGNRYHYGAPSSVIGPVAPFAVDGVTSASGSEGLTFGEWRASTGADAKGWFSESPPPAQVLIRANRYQPGRALVTVFNWKKAFTAPLDLRWAGLQSGQRYVVRDVLNPKGDPVAEGVFAGTPVNVRMSLSAVSQPVGNPLVPTVHTGMDFATFIVERVG